MNASEHSVLPSPGRSRLKRLGLATGVGAGDTVVILPAMAGGAG